MKLAPNLRCKRSDLPLLNNSESYRFHRHNKVILNEKIDIKPSTAN